MTINQKQETINGKHSIFIECFFSYHKLVLLFLQGKQK